MNENLIRKAFWLSLLLVLAFSVPPAIFYFGTVHQIFPASISKFIGVIAGISLGLGLVVFLFGFIMPVLGRYVFDNILDDKMRSMVLSFGIWRWLLNRLVAGKL